MKKKWIGDDEERKELKERLGGWRELERNSVGKDASPLDSQ